jgi:transcriptional regulator with XRE-family HTH domain
LGAKLDSVTELGPRIAELRRAAGWSQGQLAEQLCQAAERATVTKDEVNRWEHGKRRPGASWLPHLALVLGVPIEALTDPLPNPLRVAHEWLIADSPQSIESTAGRRIGAALAATVATRVVELRHLDDELGGDDLAPVVIRELRDTETLIRNAAYTEAVGRSLLTSQGELAQIAGWVASDAGRHHTAERLYLSGVAAATEAGDRALGANLLSSLSYQVAGVGRAEDALLLARSAAKGAGATTPTVRALLTERVAWAAAKAGEHTAALRALDDVDDAFEDRRGGDPDPEWVYWLSRDEVSTMRARVMVEVGRPAVAEALLTDVLARYPADAARESSLYWSWLAEAYGRAGELDAAARALATAAGFATKVNSARANGRLSEVAGLIGER